VDFNDNPDDAAFRSRTREWFAANVPDHFGPDRQIGRHDVELARRWSRKLYDAGLVGLTWPEEFGGHGLSYAMQAIFVEEQARAAAPPHLGVVGVGMVGPTIMKHGTPEQRSRHLRPILTGEEIWCQGFSEPGSGSDVAAARTTAVTDGDDLVINGQKVWSSYAHIADYCLLVVRTDPASSRHKGLSMLLVDMSVPGIDVRPLTQITGDPEFNEIFFTDVRVPSSAVLGGFGEGWAVVVTTLMHERGTSTFGLTAQLEKSLHEAIELARETGHADDALIRERLAELWLRLQGLRFTNYRSLSALERTGIPGQEGSISKLVWSTANQDLTKLSQEMCGLSALLEDEGAFWNGYWTYLQLRSRGNTIGGGTSEILHNLIAERVLGLPRSR
jgi:alkylation response protein AidB-like acyl-CoA dehydrogenase